MDTVTDRLAAMLSAATPADLDELDAEIARLSALRDLLAHALSPRTAAEPSANGNGRAPGKSAPAVRTPAPAPRGTSRTWETAKGKRNRLAVARALADGPLGRTELAERTGVSKNGLTLYLDSPWFAKTGPGKRDPWGLTEEGRAASSAATAESPP